MKIWIIFITMFFFIGCEQQPETKLDKIKSKKVQMNNIDWLKNGVWTAVQTEAAAAYYQITHYDEPADIEISIIEERAEKKDLNAIYAKNAGRLFEELNEPLGYDEKIKIYNNFYVLAKVGQINSKVRIIDLYEQYDLGNGEKGFDFLKRISNLNNRELKDLVDLYFYETINAGRKGEIKKYIEFIINEKQPRTEETTFTFDMFHRDLRQVKVLRDQKTAKEFSNIIKKTFNENKDGNLILFLMQIYTFGIGETVNLNKSCNYSKMIASTEYSQAKVYKEIEKVLANERIICNKNNHEVDVKVEFDHRALNEWYIGWK